VSVVHWRYDANQTACKQPLGDVHGFSIMSYNVTCRDCLYTDIDNLTTRARIAALDAENPLVDLPVGSFSLKGLFDHKTYDGLLSDVLTPPATVTSNTVFNTRPVEVSLLTRVSDFIASIPGNALDRKSNALAMQLRREIADAIVPKDKVRK
jgi:hypothetical protein